MLKSVFTFIFCLCLTTVAQAENLYEALGVSTDASHQDIKSAWKKLVRENHPDRFMGDPEAAKAATEKLAVINAAESILGDKTLREYYDYFSYKGTNHQRWASISGNSNVESMLKRFGTVESLKEKEKNSSAFSRTKPQPKPQPSAPQQQASAKPEQKAQPKPQPQAKTQEQTKTQSQPPPEQNNYSTVKDPVFEIFKSNASEAPDKNWLEAYRRYIVEMPSETDFVRQQALLQIMTLDFPDSKFERLGQAVILKFANIDANLRREFQSMMLSANPHTRVIAVTLVYYAIVKDRTFDFFNMSRSQAENYISERLFDTNPVVREQSRKSAEKLNLKVTAEYNALPLIQDLSNQDPNIREAALRELLTLQDFTEGEVKGLAEELLKRNALFRKHLLPRLHQEMIVLIEILENAGNLSTISEDLRNFRALTLSPELKRRAMALEERAQHSASSRVRCEMIFTN